MRHLRYICCWIFAVVLSLLCQQAHALTIKGEAAKAGVVGGAMLIGPDHTAFAAEQYAIDTIGFFSSKITPTRTTTNWSDTDNRVAWAQANGLDVHLHPLLNHPNNEAGWTKTVPSSEIPAVITERFDLIANRYGDVFAVLDVVNEALAEPGNFRSGHQFVAGFDNGIDFLEFAFLQADSRFSGSLIYNDFGTEKVRYTNKFNATVDIFVELLARPIPTPIDGYGWQMHLSTDDVLASGWAERWAARMQIISDLGLQNHVTELDIGIPDTSAAQLEKQRQAYYLVAKTFAENPTSETFATWGYRDSRSWRSSVFPLPVGTDDELKPAFFGMLAGFAAAVPEPSSWLLLVIGVGCLSFRRDRG